MGRLDAQGVSEAGTSLSAMVEHNNDGAGSPEMSKAMGKTEQEERAKTTAAQAIKGGQEARGSCAVAFTAPARRPDGHARDWKPTEARRQCSFGGGHCSLKLQKCHLPKIHKLLSNFHNNSKISKNKSCSKSKVLQLCFYNHLLIRSRF